MAQQVFVKSENGITGPYTPKQIREMASKGILLPDDLISFDQENWGNASALKGLSFPELPKQEAKIDLAKTAAQIGKSFIGKLRGAAEVASVTVSKIQSEREVSKKELIEVHNQERNLIQRFLARVRPATQKMRAKCAIVVKKESKRRTRSENHSIHSPKDSAIPDVRGRSLVHCCAEETRRECLP